MKQLLRSLVIVTLISVLTACGTAPAQKQTVDTTPKQTANSSASTTQPTEPQPEPQKAKEKAQIKVYYSNPDATNLEEEQHEITYQDNHEKYEQVLALLGHPGKKGHEALWDKFQYHSIKFKEGQLTIDASGKNVYNLGSTGELYAMDALMKSFFQFPEIQKIVILVDGKPTDSLMGHMDTSVPLTRKDLQQ
ncbi:GerMN domain-containing protein [Brevibacillus ginsengisoli]|uniref:GerMN domain-containing protein n=1 Tax=Brevibacillus ginsengisoli TaxID=363854 RepID=UPI003CED9184